MAASMTPADLQAGLVDLQTIKDLATSPAPETTDRFGVTKPTWAGLQANFEAQTTEAGGVLTGLRNEAQGFRDEAAAQASAIATTVVGGRVAATWADLLLVPTAGLPVGTKGEVTNDPTGTHVDPVTAAVVTNDGNYQWTGAAWKWIGTRDISALKTAANAQSEEVRPTTDDGNQYLAHMPQTREVFLAINRSTGKMWGAAVDLLGIRPHDSWRDVARRLDSVPISYRNGEGWNHVIIWGQSNALGSADADPVITTLASYYNLTFVGGVRADGTVDKPWTATKPLAEEVQGNNGESSASGLAEATVAYGIRRSGVPASANIQFVSISGQGATEIAGLDKPGAIYQRILDQVVAARALATAAGKEYNIHAVMGQQGETDAVNGVLSTVYEDLGLQFIENLNQDIKPLKGPQDDIHLFWSQCSYYVTNSVETNIALAQLRMTHRDKRVHVVVPTYVLPHDSDDTHRTSIGHKLEGEYEGRALEQLRQGRRPDNLEPTSAYVIGNELHLRFGYVPTYPLVLDVSYRQMVQDYGIKVVDSAGTLILSGHKISESGNEFVCTLDRPLAGNPRCRIGLDYLPWDMTPAGSGITNGAITNIRDSTYDPVVIRGVVFDRAHWALHNELPIDIITGEL